MNKIYDFILERYAVGEDKYLWNNLKLKLENLGHATSANFMVSDASLLWKVHITAVQIIAVIKRWNW